MKQPPPTYSPKEFISIHKDIRFHPRMSASEKWFYAEIQSMCEDGICEYSSRSFSLYLGVSHQAVINWIKSLSTLGLIEIIADSKLQRKKYIKIKSLHENVA